ncbi:ATP phosphoribosyltransferase regulatory subunit [Acidocella sp.]|uniref:ATP phosphoribosyltransferase regulatory subunit n=1 Tax=Acidocella sp. TaxID=50710 RepID=UPI002607494C|nr:ATP phosphoribosyltransferase regulatory subunit [Acidocella sp.]
MNETPQHPALLPSGLRDVLPPEAELEARSVAAIMDCFAAHGYERVNPPLLEFEDSLFSGSGAATADQAFRLMDPESQRMMALRADITPQIARLATTRLAASPRPLRLAYSGQCLRVRGSHLQPERQIAQAGIELIGSDTAEADAEIILTAVAALATIGLTNLSVDLTIPRLVPELLEQVDPAHKIPLAHALDRKDAAAVAELGGAPLLQQLLNASGPAERGVPALLAIEMTGESKAQILRLAATVAAIRRIKPDLQLTVDPVEFRGYQYHTGVCMTLFAPGRQAELGRGGRYICGAAEPATGITLYPDTITRLAPPPTLRQRLYLPHGTSADSAISCRAKGFATVAGLAPLADPMAEARRLGCGHIFLNGTITPLG